MSSKLLKSLRIFFAALLALCFASQEPVFAGAFGAMQGEPSLKQTYVCASPAFATIASATDLWQIYGSASKTIRVLKISAYFSNAASNIDQLYVIKRSTANSSGTPTTPTICPLDSANSAATAVVKYYPTGGANPTTGTAVANVNQLTIIPGGNQYLIGTEVVVYEANKYGQALTLRGTGEGVVLNNNGASLTGNIAVVVTFTEE
jgi:hypothetical protein